MRGCLSDDDDHAETLRTRDMESTPFFLTAKEVGAVVLRVDSNRGRLSYWKSLHSAGTPLLSSRSLPTRHWGRLSYRYPQHHRVALRGPVYGHSYGSQEARSCLRLRGGFLKKFSEKKGTGDEERRKQRLKHYALLSACAQFMLAAQSPLIGFVWKNWHHVLDDLLPHAGSSPPASGGHGGGRKNIFVDAADGPNDSSSWQYRMLWLKALCLGIFLGMFFLRASSSSSVPVGPLVDACLWLAMLFSLLLFLGWVARTLVCTVMIASGLVFTTGIKGMARTQSSLIGGILLICSILWFCVLVRPPRKGLRFSRLSLLMSIWNSKRSYSKQVSGSRDLFQTRSVKRRGGGSDSYVKLRQKS